MSRQELVNLIIGMAGVVATLSGALLAWRKWKPNQVQIQVTTADTLIDMAVEAASMVKIQRDELQAKLERVEGRLDAAEENLNACTGTIRKERERAAQAAVEAEREKFALLARVDALEEQVRRLRAESTEHFPRPGPGPHEPL